MSEVLPPLFAKYCRLFVNRASRHVAPPRHADAACFTVYNNALRHAHAIRANVHAPARRCAACRRHVPRHYVRRICRLLENTQIRHIYAVESQRAGTHGGWRWRWLGVTPPYIKPSRYQYSAWRWFTRRADIAATYARLAGRSLYLCY